MRGASHRILQRIGRASVHEARATLQRMNENGVRRCRQTLLMPMSSDLRAQLAPSRFYQDSRHRRLADACRIATEAGETATAQRVPVDVEMRTATACGELKHEDDLVSIVPRQGQGSSCRYHACFLRDDTYQPVGPCRRRPSPRRRRLTRGDGAELIYATPANSYGKVYSAQNLALSPDGTTLIFTLYTNGYDGGPNTPKGGVYKMPSAGGTATQITSSKAARRARRHQRQWAGDLERVREPRDLRRHRRRRRYLDHRAGRLRAAQDHRRRERPRRSRQSARLPGADIFLDGKTIVFEEDVSNGSSSDGYVGGIDIVPTGGGGAVRQLLVGGDASDNRLALVDSSTARKSCSSGGRT